MKLWRHCYFLIYGQFGAIWKPDFELIVCKTYNFINSNLLSYKNWKQNWKISNTVLTLLLWVKVLFWPKNSDFLQKDADISKIQWALVPKVIYSETTYECVLTCQTPKNPPRLGLTFYNTTEIVNEIRKLIKPSA